MRQDEQESASDDFEVEVSGLAEAGDPARRWQPWPSRATAGQRLLAFRRRWRWASAAGVLLVVTLSLAGSIVQPPPPGPPPPPVVLIAQQGSMACLRDLAWSPDSSRIAMIGYRQGCPGNGYEPGLLNIYSAVSGRLIRQVQPDGPILQALQQRSAGTAPASGGGPEPMIDYSSLLWSPSLQRLALTFTASALSPSPILPAAGVLLLDQAGEPERVQLQSLQFFAPTNYFEWDVQRGVLLPSAVLSTQDFSQFSSNLPIALAYRWGSNGALIPQGLANLDTPPPAPPSGPIGNPSGDASFTIWQPGTAELVTQNPTNFLMVAKPGVFAWHTFFAAWSPDGRYLLDALHLIGRVQPAGIASPHPQTLADFGADQTPLLPVRDAAFSQMLQLLPQSPTTAQQSLQLAWRPDGGVLAAYGYLVNLGQTVNLYDCATGGLLASLPPPRIGGVVSLSWSPDGSRLLWLDGATAVIWGPGWLPRW